MAFRRLDIADAPSLIRQVWNTRIGGIIAIVNLSMCEMLSMFWEHSAFLGMIECGNMMVHKRYITKEFLFLRSFSDGTWAAIWTSIAMLPFWLLIVSGHFQLIKFFKAR